MMEKKKTLLKNKKVIVAVIVAILILIGSVYACVFVLSSFNDKKDNNGGNIETVVSEDSKNDTSDTSSKPSTSDKDTESKPTESKPNEKKEPIESEPKEDPDEDNDNIQKKNITFKNAEEVENMTDEQLVDYYKNYNIIIPDYYSHDRLNIPYIEGEIFGAVSSISATSAEDAKRKITEFGFLETANSYDITFLGEDKYFYEFRITFSYGEVTYIYRYLAYKEEAIHYSHSISTGSYQKINMLDKDSVLNIMDFIVGKRNIMVFRQLEETETEYIYNYYTFAYVRGDWGLRDTVSLVKSFIKVDKKTGETRSATVQEREKIKTVAIGEVNQLIID